MRNLTKHALFMLLFFDKSNNMGLTVCYKVYFYFIKNFEAELSPLLHMHYLYISFQALHNQFLFTPGLMWLLEATLDFWKSGTLKRSRSLAHIYQNKMYVIPYSFCLGQEINNFFILFSHQLGGKERVLNSKLNGLGLSFLFNGWWRLRLKTLT